MFYGKRKSVSCCATSILCCIPLPEGSCEQSTSKRPTFRERRRPDLRLKMSLGLCACMCVLVGQVLANVARLAAPGVKYVIDAENTLQRHTSHGPEPAYLGQQLPQHWPLRPQAGNVRHALRESRGSDRQVVGRQALKNVSQGLSPSNAMAQSSHQVSRRTGTCKMHNAVALTAFRACVWVASFHTSPTFQDTRCSPSCSTPSPHTTPTTCTSCQAAMSTLS